MKPMNMQGARFATRAIHAGQAPDPATGALNTPIYETSTFAFPDSEALRYGLDHRMQDRDIYFYCRGTNPTVAALERKIANLESAEDAIAAASGMGAISSVLYALLRQGDHMVVSSDLFVCSHNLFSTHLPAKGISTTSVNILDLDEVERSITDRTRIIYLELLSNPRLELADLKCLVELAHSRGILLVVDNTFLSPCLIRPLEYGADLVVHSATKYIAGHGDALGGVAAGSRALLEKIRPTHNDMGACISPFNAWLLLRGIRTLPLRMQAISANAQAIAQFLASRPEVEWVIYPGLPDHPQHSLALELLPSGMGGIVSFHLKGGEAEMERFVDSVTIPSIATSLGDVQTLIYPRHHDGNLIRLAVGCEDIEDLLEDFRQAFAQLR